MGQNSILFYTRENSKTNVISTHSINASSQRVWYTGNAITKRVGIVFSKRSRYNSFFILIVCSPNTYACHLSQIAPRFFFILFFFRSFINNYILASIARCIGVISVFARCLYELRIRTITVLRSITVFRLKKLRNAYKLHTNLYALCKKPCRHL